MVPVVISSQPWLLLGRSLLSDPWWIRLNPWVWVNLWKKVSSMVGVFHCWKKSGIQKWPGFLCFWVSKIDHVWWRWTFNIFQPQNFKADTWSAQEIQKSITGGGRPATFVAWSVAAIPQPLRLSPMHLLFQHPKVPKWTRTWFFHYSILSRIHIFIQYIYISYVIGTDIYIYIYLICR